MPATASLNIREARRDAGLSQQALAQRADCSIGWIRQIEAGVQPGPGSHAYRRILEVLGIEDDPAGKGEVVKNGEAAPHGRE